MCVCFFCIWDALLLLWIQIQTALTLSSGMCLMERASPVCFHSLQVFIYRNVGCGSAGTWTRCWKYVEKLAPDTLKEWFTKNEHHLLSFNHPHFAPDFLFSVEDKKRENVLAALFPCDAYEWRLGLLSSNKALKMFQKSFVLVTIDFHCTYSNKKC